MNAEQWQELAANSLVIGTAVITALKGRRKQNHLLAERLAEEVTEIRNEVSTVKTIISIHKEDLRDNTLHLAILAAKVESLEKMLPEIQDTMAKVLNFFERKKAGTLETHEVSPGITAIKKKESNR